MKLHLFIFTFPFFVVSLISASHASSIKVNKVKGKQAVVVFSGTSPESGATYEISDGDGRHIASEGGYGAREMTLAMGAGFSSAKSASGFLLSGRFGLNKKKMEYGGILGLVSSSDGAVFLNGESKAKGTTFGGFFDYNFSPNIPSAKSVMSGTAQVTITSGTLSTATDITLISFGGSYKWFGLGASSTCIRADALYNMVSGGSSGSSDRNHLSVAAGLQVYF